MGCPMPMPRRARRELPTASEREDGAAQACGVRVRGANDSTKPATPPASAADGPKVSATMRISGVSDGRLAPYARVPTVTTANET